MALALEIQKLLPPLGNKEGLYHFNHPPCNPPTLYYQWAVPPTIVELRYSLLNYTEDQAFKRRENWTIEVSRVDSAVGTYGKDSIARIFRRVYRNSKEVIIYGNDRIIPGITSEEMAAKYGWYEMS
ncbi:hypothetical protein O181_102093 [Austropuccinia psidii MF-1]|uniref:Uncharacterized protein n=1 Tax=Austropuccinia psidii MF-1 TaxID=1389203 RepID=A0A9Q3JHS6_9BASI|nr:hypothetical protein [Austropuccinia psidii MF-1]